MDDTGNRLFRPIEEALLVEASLEEKIVGRVREWFKRSAPDLDKGRNPHVAEITIRIHDRQGDEDGTLYLDATVEETRYDEFGGLVPGTSFDTNG